MKKEVTKQRTSSSLAEVIHNFHHPHIAQSCLYVKNRWADGVSPFSLTPLPTFPCASEVEKYFLGSAWLVQQSWFVLCSGCKSVVFWIWTHGLHYHCCWYLWNKSQSQILHVWGKATLCQRLCWITRKAETRDLAPKAKVQRGHHRHAPRWAGGGCDTSGGGDKSRVGWHPECKQRSHQAWTTVCWNTSSRLFQWQRSEKKECRDFLTVTVSKKLKGQKHSRNFWKHFLQLCSSQSVSLSVLHKIKLKPNVISVCEFQIFFALPPTNAKSKVVNAAEAKWNSLFDVQRRCKKSAREKIWFVNDLFR